MATIQLNEGARLVGTTGPTQWTLETLRIAGPNAKNPGEEHWTGVGWWPKLGMALTHVLEHDIAGSQAEGIAELRAVVLAARDDIVSAVGGS